MPNLIVILFNLIYPVLYVGFHCKGCVRESVKTQDSLKIKDVFMGSLREDFSWSEACAHMTGMWKFMTDGDSWFLRMSRG